jgi:succinoglycan biosynthesis protein ExoW
MQTVAVVIPFHQRDPSILRRCLDSVLAQRISPDCRFLVVIVDDESPVPLEAVIEDVVVPPPHELVCLSRPNGGPGAARNTALDYLNGRPVEFVAFIDSDDSWRPDHISRALGVLGDDADFFFCDHDRWDFPKGNLEGSRTFQGWLASSDRPFSVYAVADFGAAPVYEFKPHRVLVSFLQDYLSHTSTVVYRRRGHEALRFDESLRRAGEDDMFWLQLSERARAVRFTTAKDAETGKGVNIWAGSSGWWHPDATERQAAAVRFRLKIYKTLVLDSEERIAADRRLALCEAELAQVLFRKFLKAPIAALKILLPLLRTKPSLAVVLPLRLFNKVEI